MIIVPLLGQRDSRWVNTKLGFGDGTIGNYGCTLTCLTALSGKTNVSEVNNLFKATGNYPTNPKGAFQNNLVVWSNVPNALSNLKFVYRYYYYDNNKVADYVYNKKIPVLVEVNATPIGSPKGKHWLLFLGDQRCLDPWVGQIRWTGDFPVRTGFALFDYVALPQPPLTDTDKLNKVREILHRADLGDTQKVLESLKITG